MIIAAWLSSVESWLVNRTCTVRKDGLSHTRAAGIFAPTDRVHRLGIE